MTPALAGFWANYLALSHSTNAHFYEAFHFGDHQALADQLVMLVLTGAKRATSSAAWSFAQDGKRMPKAGDISIVTNWSGTPLCIIETVRIDVCAFDDVTAEFAASEGEGDGSLTGWRAAHREYFSRACARHGRVFSEQMPVACERFEVVYKDPNSALPR